MQDRIEEIRKQFAAPTLSYPLCDTTYHSAIDAVRFLISELDHLGSQNTALLLEVKRLNDKIEDHVSSKWYNVEREPFLKLKSENAALKAQANAMMAQIKTLKDIREFTIEEVIKLVRAEFYKHKNEWDGLCLIENIRNLKTKIWASSL